MMPRALPRASLIHHRITLGTPIAISTALARWLHVCITKRGQAMPDAFVKELVRARPVLNGGRDEPAGGRRNLRRT